MDVVEREAKERALRHAIEEKRKEDPLIGAKLGSKELLDRIISALEKKNGVHIESLLCILGSLAGYACHSAIREALVDTGKLPENGAFTILGGADGNRYYFGDYVNQPLVQDRFSFWALIAGEAKHHGAVSLPDLNLTFSTVSKTVGSDRFGIPNIPEQHTPGSLPLKYLKSLWSQVNVLLNKYCESPVEKPILIGMSAQKAIEMGKDVIPPESALLILMESAIPMSKIGPEWIA